MLSLLRVLMFYRITVRGNVGDRLGDVFPNLNVYYDGEQSVIEGPVRDQTQLHGILALIRDLNLTLLTVESSR